MADMFDEFRKAILKQSRSAFTPEAIVARFGTVLDDLASMVDTFTEGLKPENQPPLSVDHVHNWRWNPGLDVVCIRNDCEARFTPDVVQWRKYKGPVPKRFQ